MSPADFGGEGAQRVWALVCGYPSEQRLARRLIMLQAYMDESERGEFFVLAGYVSSVPKWAAFADEWDRLLHHGSAQHFPRLEEFHMAEMMASDERREMVPWFHRVIERHVEFGIELVIPSAFIKDEFAKMQWPEWMKDADQYKNPYLIAFNGLFNSLRMHGHALGIEEKVDFIFDRRTQDEEQCRRAWDNMSKDSGFAELVGEGPLFRDSKLNKPLQAADFIAYWVRNWAENGVRPATGYLPFPWAAEKDIPTLALYLDRAYVRSDWEHWIKQAEAERAGVKLPPKFRINWRDEV